MFAHFVKQSVLNVAKYQKRLYNTDSRMIKFNSDINTMYTIMFIGMFWLDTHLDNKNLNRRVNDIEKSLDKIESK